MEEEGATCFPDEKLMRRKEIRTDKLFAYPSPVKNNSECA
jgi:hypothetical protein